MNKNIKSNDFVLSFFFIFMHVCIPPRRRVEPMPVDYTETLSPKILRITTLRITTLSTKHSAFSVFMLTVAFLETLLTWRHDTQYNDIQYNHI